MHIWRLFGNNLYKLWVFHFFFFYFSAQICLPNFTISNHEQKKKQCKTIHNRLFWKFIVIEVCRCRCCYMIKPSKSLPAGVTLLLTICAFCFHNFSSVFDFNIFFFLYTIFFCEDSISNGSIFSISIEHFEIAQ